jgi:phasin family protein
MFAISEQFSHATKAAFDEQLLGFSTLVEAVFDSGVGVIDLNVDAVKASMAAGAVATNLLLAVKDGRDWMSLTVGQSQQALERVSAYGRQAVELASEVRAHFSTITPGKLLIAKETVVESAVAVKKSPIRTLPVDTLSKVAVDIAQEGYDIPVRAGKKKTEESAVAIGASVTRGQA